MTITIADGRGALWQWDTGRRVKITDGVGVKQIHYQNRCIGCSVDVDVGDDGTAIIPDELLQGWHPLTAYAYVTDDAGGYTKVQQDFAVYKRVKPADYVYTPTEHAGFDRLRPEVAANTAARHSHANKGVLDGITAAKTAAWDGKSSFSGRYADLTGKPAALKNPNALTIKIGGTTVTYDGSAAKTVTIADGSEVAY